MIERGRATRERLLAATVALVGEVGWGGVTTRLVAERAEVNPGVVHYHFASVTDLLVAACVEFADGLLEETMREVVAAPDVAAGIDRLLADLARFDSNDPATLVLAEAYLASTRLPALRTALGELVERFRAAVVTWLASRGDVPDPEAAAVALAAVIDGVMLHRGLDPGLDVVALGGPLRRMLGVTR